MKTSIATVSIAGDLEEKLAAIAAAGFDGVEIFEHDFIAHDGGPAEVGRMVRDHGLEITLFQPFRDFEGLPEPHRARAFDRAERKFDLMGQLGVDLVLVCSNVSPDAIGGVDRAAADLTELGERAAKRGIRIGYEALAWGRHVNDHRDAWEIVRRADHASVGLILDSFHSFARHVPVDSIRSIPGDKIFFVQLADAPLIEMDLLYWSRHFRNMPGEGDLDVESFMRAVMAAGYSGPISLEIFNDQFRGGSPRAIAVDGRRSLLYLMDRVRRAEPTLNIDAPQMPDRVAAKGIEFIEFAADEAEAKLLAQALQTLGFAKAGSHVSKSVDVWRQGEINIVVNTEREGFAAAAHHMHGLTVCDVGLKVEDAAATVARAEVLGASVFTQPTAPGELEIPAIRGVGGGVMHFVDEKSELARVWEIEFRTPQDEGPSAGEAGLTRIDHIAQTMNYEEMLTWTLFYSSIFQVERTPMVDLVDPGGLVRNQAIQSPDGRLRVTMSGAETHRTFAGRFIADSFGSSVQHVALATDDIFTTADRLRSLGFEALEMSPNYYDDLVARFGLEPEKVEQMRAANVLYDRDADGEFLQIYSRLYGAGLFFEIVERRGAYNGYGAPNASFVIAAQKRMLRAATAGA